MLSKHKIPQPSRFHTTGKAKSRDKRSAKTLAQAQTVDRRPGARSRAKRVPAEASKQQTASSVSDSSAETEREKPPVLVEAYETVQRVEDKYFQVLKKYKELKAKSQKEAGEEVKALKLRAEQIRALEDKLGQLVRDNELLKAKMLEIDQKFAERQTPKLDDRDAAERAKAAHDRQVAQLQLQIRELEARCEREVQAKQREFQEKLESSAQKHRQKELRLKSQILQLRQAQAPQPSESRSRSRSDRTPSPLNVKRLLGDAAPAPTRLHSKQQLKPQPQPKPQPEESVKRLEQLVLKVLEEYKDLKSENLQVASKLDNIERFLEKLDSLKPRTPNRLSSMDPKRLSQTPDRNVLSTDLHLAASRSGDNLWKEQDPDSDPLRHEAPRTRPDRKERLGSLTTVNRPEFFTQPQPQARAQSPFPQPQRARRGEPAGEEPAGWTANYGQLIQQMRQMKQEFRDLDEENRTLYQLM